MVSFFPITTNTKNTLGKFVYTYTNRRIKIVYKCNKNTESNGIYSFCKTQNKKKQTEFAKLPICLWRRRRFDREINVRAWQWFACNWLDVLYNTTTMPSYTMPSDTSKRPADRRCCCYCARYKTKLTHRHMAAFVSICVWCRSNSSLHACVCLWHCACVNCS